MAVRLSVIMVHTVPPTLAAGRTAEAVVGELIGRAGIDLTLVGPLAELGESRLEALRAAIPRAASDRLKSSIYLEEFVVVANGSA